jgi:hypothetical protein
MAMPVLSYKLESDVMMRLHSPPYCAVQMRECMKGLFKHNQLRGYEPGISDKEIWAAV